MAFLPLLPHLTKIEVFIKVVLQNFRKKLREVAPEYLHLFQLRDYVAIVRR